MIKLTTMSNKAIVINANLIEKIESMPETVITLTSGKKIIVKDSIDEVINKAINFQSRTFKQSGTFSKEVE